MLPISAIPPGLSAYGITPQMEAAMQDMTTKLPGISGVGTDGGASQVAALPGSSSDSFGSMLGKFVQEVNGKQADAGNAVASLQAGGNASLHQTVIAMEEANVSFQLMVEVRNKLLESYQEIMRMQI